MRDEGGGRTWGGAGSRERGGGTSASSSSPLPGRERSAQGVRAPSTGAVGSTQEVTASSTGGHEPPQGVEVDRWAAALRGALRGVLAADEVDIGPALTVDGDPEPGTLALATDDWALTVEGLTDVAAADPPCLPPQAPKDIPPPSSPADRRVVAWLAVDDEPDDPARHPAARRALMPEPVDRALAAADAALAGALRAALVAGADPFSQDLARALSSG